MAPSCSSTSQTTAGSTRAKGSRVGSTSMAVFRAVETRRYLVRAATTGTSAVVDPYGRLIGSLPPGTAGVLTTPVVGRRTLTPYVRLGDLFALACAGIAAAALVGQPRQLAQRRRSPPRVPAAS